MRIILGVFGDSFTNLKMNHDCKGYGYWCEYPETPTNFSEENNGVIPTVNTACDQATEIYFDLTKINFVLDHTSFENSVTISELYLIITTPEYLEKTVFFKDGVVVDKEYVLNWFLHDPFWKQFE